MRMCIRGFPIDSSMKLNKPSRGMEILKNPFASEISSASVVDLAVLPCLPALQAMGKQVFGPAITHQHPELLLVCSTSPQKSASTNNQSSHSQRLSPTYPFNLKSLDRLM